MPSRRNTRAAPTPISTRSASPALEAAHAEGLADAVDGFCEGIAFSPEQIARVFERASEARGIPVKLHAEQLSNLGGAKLAARIRRAVGGSSRICHGRRCGSHGRKSGSVAVILPGAFYTLRETVAPPIQAFREAGVPMAVATDCNPGSSPMSSLLLEP
jgi:imidazolonepropionase